MSLFNRRIVKDYLRATLGHIFEMDDTTRVIDLILEDVVKDIEDTADEEFNLSDINIALARVLKARLGIES